MTILRLAIRGVRANLGRLLLTTIAVVAGVGFAAGSFILADSLGNTIDALLASNTDTPDAQIQLTEPEFGHDDRAIPDSIVAEVAALPEVDRAQPGVFFETVGQFAIVDDAGNEIKPGFGRFTFAQHWDGEEGEGTTIVEGAAPVGIDHVAIDQGSATAASVGVGDEVTIATPVGRRTFEVTAILDVDQGGNYVLLFDFPTAQVLFDKEGEVDHVILTRATGVSTDEMMAAVEAVLPEQATVLSFEDLIAEANAEVEQYLALTRNVLLGFAGIALFVSLFIIYNTFTILVTQRLQQIGMLRAIGTTKGQIRNIVIVEALVIGIVGGLIGLGFGYVIAAGLQAIIESRSGFDTTTVVAARTVIVAMVIAVGATMVSALVPSFLAGRVSPVTAMRGETPARSSVTRRIAAGGAVLAVGLVLVAVGLFGGGQSTSTLVAELAIGSMLTFVGVALLSVLFAGPVVAFVGRPPVLGTGLTALGVALPVLMFTLGDGVDGMLFAPKMAVSVLAVVIGISVLLTWLRGGRRTGLGGSAGGLTGQLARQNAARSPRRTAATATALTMGIALVSAFGVVGESLKATQSDIIDRAVKADLFVASDTSTGSDSSVSGELADRLEVMSGVAEVSRIHYNNIRIGDDVDSIAAYEAGTGERLIDLAVSDGSVDGLLDNGVLVFADTAEDRSLRVGDPVTVEFPDGGTAQLVVAGIFDDSGLESDWVIDLAVYQRHVSVTDDNRVALSFAADADADAVTAEVQALADEIGSYEVLSTAELNEQIESELNLTLTIVNALLGLTLFIAFLGVVNTIVLSVIERTREVGLLRAVGMTRRQIKGTIRWESVMVCLFGAALGIAIGVLFAWAAVTAIPDDAIATVAIPYESVLFTVLVAVLAGVLAAVIPARRAARLDVLDAIATTG